jgi:hypothetical protein
MHTPPQFQPDFGSPYPPGNFVPFEKWFHLNQGNNNDNVGRTFLPIYWTAYYIAASHGKNHQMLAQLQQFINSLPKHKKYYTIVQYDDGIITDLSNLDIIIFGMGGGHRHHTLPLLYQPFTWSMPFVTQKYFASFVGQITHPLRKQLVELHGKNSNFHIRIQHTHPRQYAEILASSLYTLCPRGYGITSFRLIEALQYHSVPVYISDEFAYPYDCKLIDYCVQITPSELPNLPEILQSITPEQYQQLKHNGQTIYNKYFNYSEAAKFVYDTLKNY